MYNLNYTPTTLGVREQKRLNTTDTEDRKNTAKITEERFGKRDADGQTYAK
jgi:hypothetical protein